MAFEVSEADEWIRILHGNGGGNDSLVLDFDLEEIKMLALTATRVRIQDAGDPQRSVTSLPETLPIENVRKGLALQYGMNSLSISQVPSIWEASRPDLIGHLNYSNMNWGESDRFSEQQNRLDKAVYHACDNAGGIHWYKRDVSHHSDRGHVSTCGWRWSSNAALELLLDRRPTTVQLYGSMTDDKTIDVIAISLSGEQLAQVSCAHDETGNELRLKLQETVGAISMVTNGVMLDTAAMKERVADIFKLNTMEEGAGAGMGRRPAKRLKI